MPLSSSWWKQRWALSGSSRVSSVPPAPSAPSSAARHSIRTAPGTATRTEPGIATGIAARTEPGTARPRTEPGTARPRTAPLTWRFRCERGGPGGGGTSGPGAGIPERSTEPGTPASPRHLRVQHAANPGDPLGAPGDPQAGLVSSPARSAWVQS